MKTDAEKKELYQKLIAEEIANFVTENKKAIVKRAEKRLRKMATEQGAT